MAVPEALTATETGDRSGEADGVREADRAGVAGQGDQVDQQALLAWGEAELRDLPWRRSRDPWAVLLSEVMAQQTGVDRVIPYWHAFLRRFPDPAACAAAPVADVLRLWAGLGYNRRGVSLHRCAVAIVERHGGVVPADLDALLALPGVGPYTARAVLAFAHEQPVGVVDTNVGRVLARWEGRPLATSEAQARADHLAHLAHATRDEVGVAEASAERLVRRDDAIRDEAGLARAPTDQMAATAVVRSPGDRAATSGVGAGASRAWLWNQTIMELGAVVCGRRRPTCGLCPVRSGCGWHAAGGPGGAGRDPADGSAGVGKGQSRFEGSDRQGRGRLVDALRSGPVAEADLATVMGWSDDPDRARRVAKTVVTDGLAITDGATFALPQ